MPGSNHPSTRPFRRRAGFVLSYLKLATYSQTSSTDATMSNTPVPARLGSSTMPITNAPGGMANSPSTPNMAIVVSFVSNHRGAALDSRNSTPWR